jgi:hypothetical protein
MEPTAAGKIRYEVFGPFPFLTDGTTTHRLALRAFWAEREKDARLNGLSAAVGVYVWTYREHGRRTPWNVGLTDRQGFKRRFEQKEASFLRLLRDQPNSEIEVYLLALRSKSGKFRKPREAGVLKANGWLETMLIGAAIKVNPKLRNQAKVKYLRNAIVDGYLNDDEEKRNKSARTFSELFKPQRRKRD